jgi:glyceraldehyde-3-phosphate dehydrogenase (NAD(P))
MGLELDLFSSALKLNTQYMHVIQYHLQLNKPTNMDSLLERINANDRIAVTYKKTANSVFSFGRDHGYFGRILNQTVIPTETLAVIEGGKEVVGYCFTPQDGNSILSSIAATLWALYPDSYEERVQCLKEWYFDEV